MNYYPSFQMDFLNRPILERIERLTTFMNTASVQVTSETRIIKNVIKLITVKTA